MTMQECNEEPSDYCPFAEARDMCGRRTCARVKLQLLYVYKFIYKNVLLLTLGIERYFESIGVIPAIHFVPNTFCNLFFFDIV